MCSYTIYLTSDVTGWSTPRSGRFTSGKDQVTVLQGAWWAPGLVMTGVENLTPPGFEPSTVQPVATRV